MAEMKDLKRRPTDPEDAKFYKDPSKDEYFPLSLYLDTVEIDALGLGSANVGDERILIAKVRVTNKSTNESGDRERTSSMGLALVEGCTEAKADAKSAAEAIYRKE